MLLVHSQEQSVPPAVETNPQELNNHHLSADVKRAKQFLRNIYNYINEIKQLLEPHQ